jgi:hypothetical protein
VLAALTITVLTMSPGNDIFARFGHTALLIDGDGEGEPKVYNFGAYRGSDPQIVSQFVHNAIPYYLSVNDVDRFAWKYRDRDVVGQELALSDDEAHALVARLEWTLRPENRAYRYDWFRNNCTTKTRDAIDDAVGGVWRPQLAGQPARTHGTIRALLVDALATLPSVATLFSLSLNGRVDQPLDAWQELAMPADLMAGLRRAHRPDGRPLVADEWLWRGPAARPLRQPGWLQPLGEALLIYLLILGAFAGSRVAGGVGLVLWGGLSVLVAVWLLCWTVISYPDCFASINLVGYSPLGVLWLTDGVRLLRRRPPGRWSGPALLVVTVGVVVALVLSPQVHLRFALYALAASALSWLTVRAARGASRSG